MKTKIEMIEVPVVIPTPDGDRIERTVKVMVPAVFDPETNDYLLSDEVLQELDKVKARHMGLLSPEEIRQLRAAHNLTQKELSELLQMGEKTVTRWESGNDRPSRSMNILLRGLWDGELSVDYLKSIRTAPRKSMPAPPTPTFITLVPPRFVSFEDAPEKACHETNATAA